MLAILSTFLIGGEALFCVIPTCLWLCLSTGQTGPYIAPTLAEDQPGGTAVLALPAHCHR